MHNPLHPHDQRVVATFLEEFLHPPKADSPDQIKLRLLYLAELVNGLADAHDPVSAHQRKMALQSIRRLAARYPHLASQLVLERKAKVTA
jgi:hypothetical protein